MHPKTTGLITRARSAASRSPRCSDGPSRGWRRSSRRLCSVSVQDRVEFRAGKNYYQLVVQADGGEPKLYRKRYSEFAEVHDKMKQAYVGSHLRASLPAPPAKILNPFFDQLEPTFVQNRQVELNDYVKKIITVPRALAQPALLDFLGLALRAPSGEPADLSPRRRPRGPAECAARGASAAAAAAGVRGGRRVTAGLSVFAPAGPAAAASRGRGGLLAKRSPAQVAEFLEDGDSRTPEDTERGQRSCKVPQSPLGWVLATESPRRW